MSVTGSMKTTRQITMDAERLAKVNAKLSALKKEKEELEKSLIMAMLKDEVTDEYYQYIRDTDGNIICEYASRRGSHFDSTNFKVAEPSLYAQYLLTNTYWGVKTHK